MEKLKAYTCWFNTDFVEEARAELIYAETLEQAVEAYELLHGDPPDHAQRMEIVEDVWAPKKHNPKEAHICHNESALRAAGFRFDGDYCCDSCGTYWNPKLGIRCHDCGFDLEICETCKVPINDGYCNC